MLYLLLAASLPLGGFLPRGQVRAGGVEPVLVPPPAMDLPPGAGRLERALLAGGCFWGVQGVYQHVDGVVAAISGYSGGTADTAHYEAVSDGTTDHAESVEVTYDPARVSFGMLLRIFFSVVHDPTQVDRQGPDVGRQYRSAIFPTSAAQHEVAAAYIAQLDASGVFGRPIATRIEPESFFRAEDVHQDFMLDNPRNPYIVVNDLPKVEHLARLFPEHFRAEPARARRGGRAHPRTEASAHSKSI
jgi:peptide-methionine (S)-S-oxide reductase